MAANSSSRCDILVVGATGLVGDAFLRQSKAHQQQLKITALVRKPGRLPADTAVEIVAPNDQWPEIIASLQPEAVFCALGTTIRQAGSQAAFRGVDFELVAAVAGAAKSSGAMHFITVSSVMANARARSFYLKTKGEAEEALIAEGFERLDLLRPGLLRGDRRELRLGELIGAAASPIVDHLLLGPFKKFRSVHADTVALAALNLLTAKEPGCFIHDSEQLRELSN
ncbi:MAG: NAD(P)H-binding protein [Halioglobus sp.]